MLNKNVDIYYEVCYANAMNCKGENYEKKAVFFNHCFIRGVLLCTNYIKIYGENIKRVCFRLNGFKLHENNRR